MNAVLLKKENPSASYACLMAYVARQKPRYGNGGLEVNFSTVTE